MTSQWHELRAAHVGGSEVAALFDESPYLSRYRLWLYKSKKLDAPDLSNNERVQAGQHLEHGALHWANAKWGFDFRPAKVYAKHPTVVGMGCTPDGLDYTRGRPVLAQVKFVDRNEFSQKWEAKGDTITHAPLHIMLQVQHELEVMQLDDCHLIVVVGGNRIVQMLCKRDHEISSMLRKEVMGFWLSIELGDMPAPNFETDGQVIKEFRKRLPVVIDLTLEGEYAHQLAANWVAQKVEMKKAVDKFEATDAELEHLIGNAQNVQAGDIVLRRNKVGTIRADVNKPVF